MIQESTETGRERRGNGQSDTPGRKAARERARRAAAARTPHGANTVGSHRRDGECVTADVVLIADVDDTPAWMHVEDGARWRS